MTRKEKTSVALVVTVMTFLGAIASASFTMGQDKQAINDKIRAQDNQLKILETSVSDHKDVVENEINRLVTLLAVQLSQLCDKMDNIDTSVSDISAEVKVLQAIIIRLEKKMDNTNR